jgi:hypothetical protein
MEEFVSAYMDPGIANYKRRHRKYSIALHQLVFCSFLRTISYTENVTAACGALWFKAYAKEHSGIKKNKYPMNYQATTPEPV